SYLRNHLLMARAGGNRLSLSTSLRSSEVSFSVLQSFDAAAPAVYVKTPVAEESDQSHSAALGRCYREAGRGADSGEQRNAGHRSLLHKLKAGSPADQHHRIA